MCVVMCVWCRYLGGCVFCMVDCRLFVEFCVQSSHPSTQGDALYRCDYCVTWVYGVYMCVCVYVCLLCVTERAIMSREERQTSTQ